LYDDLVMLPCYQWNHAVVAPPGHPLLEKSGKITLGDVAEWPIITYDSAFAGRSRINRAFRAKGLNPNVVLTAIDADVIKTYVALGMGIGIIASIAFDADKDQELRALDASHLFEPNTTRIGLLRNYYPRGFIYDFIEMFAPHLDRASVDEAMSRG
jgi:LysR family cys regulon transcriptional activator